MIIRLKFNYLSHIQDIFNRKGGYISNKKLDNSTFHTVCIVYEKSIVSLFHSKIFLLVL